MKRAFLDPVTRVLKCVGYVAANDPGDIAMDVPDDFEWEPGTCRHDGTDWVGWTRPPSAMEVESGDVLSRQKVQAFLAMTAAERAAWVQANVTDLASAKDVITDLVVAVGYLLKR